MKEQFKAWAIDSRSKEGHGFIGRYWCFGGKYPEIPVGLSGCKIVLFPTRELARKHLFEVRRSPFQKARVIRVLVTIEG